MTLNEYCWSLVALCSQSAHRLKEVGDQWRTPDLLFWGINALFGPLVLDSFADADNVKCPAWHTAEDNALTRDQSERLDELGSAVFANPPYSHLQYHDKQATTGMVHIMNHVMDMRERGGRYAYLMKSATNEAWWPRDADHIMFIRGRIGLDLPMWFVPADEKQKLISVFFAGAIVVFDESWRGERFSYINRTELKAKGRVFMALAQFAVGKEQTTAARTAQEPVVPLETESRIWSLEVGLVFNQVGDVDVLSEAQQNKLKANISQLWLERTATSEIITIIRGLAGSMQGVTHA